MLAEKKAEPAKPELAANLPADVSQIDSKPAKDEGAGKPAASEGEGDVKLEKVNFDEFLARIAADKTAKYTMVDAWATWCGPCKENFPHVVEMHQKYGGKGLAVVSLSFDDPAVPSRSATPGSSSPRRRPTSPTSCSTRSRASGSRSSTSTRSRPSSSTAPAASW